MARHRPRPVRVLFMDHVPRMSGAEQSLFDLVVGVSRGPVEAVVALPSDGPLAAELRAHGVLVRTVGMNRRLLETSRETLARAPLAAVGRLFAYLAAAWRTFRLIREVRPDVMHTNTLKTHLIALLPCMASRTPLIWHVRDILPPGWLRSMLVMLARFTAIVIVPSRAVGEAFRGHRRAYRKLRLIPNGVRVSEFAQAATDRSLRQMIGAASQDPVVGIVGRIAPWKGQDVFLRSAAMLANRYPKAYFAVIGAPMFPQDATFEQELHQMAIDLGIEERVAFLGWQPAPEAMAALDVFVHASAEPEPFGRAIVEAMAAGKPVVAAAGGAVQEIVPPAAGFIVPPGRPEQLADALDRLLEDRKLRKRMGEAGAAIAESFFPVERTVQSVAQLHRALAARAARKRRRVSARMPKRARRRRPIEQQHPAERPLVWPRGEDRPTRRPGEPHAPKPRPGSSRARSAPVSAPVSVPVQPEQDEPVQDPDVATADVSDEPVRVVHRTEPPTRPTVGRASTATLEAPPRRAIPLRRASSRPVAVRGPAAAAGAAGAAATAVATMPVASPVSAPAVRPAPAPVVRPVPAPRRTLVEPQPVYDALKRALDLTLAFAALVIGLPVWILIAIAIKLESPGPVLHRGTVVGKGCRPFTYYKFRSMRIDRDDRAHRRFIERYVRENGGHEAEGEIVYKLLGDDRVTAVGRFIRRLSLDEIPQLINVVRGEMSIVGPRPPLDYEFEHYDERAKARLSVLPGITGMQQVWHRHTASFEEKLSLDLKYMRDRSLWLDIKLIMHSVRAALSGH